MGKFDSIDQLCVSTTQTSFIEVLIIIPSAYIRVTICENYLQYVAHIVIPWASNIQFYVFAVHRENRYLLFLTENDAALEIMHRFLFQREDTQPHVLFGSSFPKDKDYTQVCTALILSRAMG